MASRRQILRQLDRTLLGNLQVAPGGANLDPSMHGRNHSSTTLMEVRLGPISGTHGSSVHIAPSCRLEPGTSSWRCHFGEIMLLCLPAGATCQTWCLLHYTIQICKTVCKFVLLCQLGTSTVGLSIALPQQQIQLDRLPGTSHSTCMCQGGSLILSLYHLAGGSLPTALSQQLPGLAIQVCRRSATCLPSRLLCNDT